jgi:DNA replication protein DnaC
MDITSKTESRQCEGCGKAYEYEALTFNGTEVCVTSLCDPCAEKHNEKVEQEQRKATAINKWTQCVPDGYRDTDINHPDYQARIKTHDLCMRWVNGESMGQDGRRLFLGLIGDSGLCKTRIISQMVKRMIWRGRSVFWINSSQFQWSCQHLHDDSERGKASRAIKSARNCSVLVLDDIGSLKATEIVSDNLYAILEHRTTNKLPMIWTSNETLDEMLPGNKISEKAKRRNVSRLAGYSNIIGV